jgi:DNA-binding protein
LETESNKRNRLEENHTIGEYHNVFISAAKSIPSFNKCKTEERGGEMSESNSVLIGRKPVMNYVLACITLFHGGANEVNVKARGRAISRAVDVVEVTRRRFMPDVKVKKIDIGTDQLAPIEEGGTPTNVSTIEITLAK